MNKSFLAIVLLSSSLGAHKEVVREIAHNVERSEMKSAQVHLQRLHRFSLPQNEHKKIIKDLQDTAKQVRETQENNVRVGNSWIDGISTVGGSALVMYGLKTLLGSGRVQRERRSLLQEDDGYGQRSRQGSGSSFLGRALYGLPLLAAGGYAAYKGYKCWYQQRCIGAAKKMQECLEDALLEVKEG